MVTDLWCRQIIENNKSFETSSKIIRFKAWHLNNPRIRTQTTPRNLGKSSIDTNIILEQLQPVLYSRDHKYKRMRPKTAGERMEVQMMEKAKKDLQKTTDPIEQLRYTDRQKEWDRINICTTFTNSLGHLKSSFYCVRKNCEQLAH